MRRRADAERNIAVILEAAVETMSRRPGASIEDVADAAGVTRQTVYAHFPSRAALITAAIDWVTDTVVAAMDAARPDEGPPVAALARVVDAGWQGYERYSRLLGLTPPDPDADSARHEPVRQLFLRLIERGQQTGDFDRRLPSTWLATVAITLSHAIADEVACGRMLPGTASATLEKSILRVLAGG